MRTVQTSQSNIRINKYPMVLQVLFLLILSGCTFGGSGSNSSINAQLVKFDLLYYTNTEVFLVASGKLPEEYTTGQSSVDFHLDKSCAGVSVGSGISDNFKTDGIQIVLPISSAPSKSSVYVASNTVGGCYFLGDYYFPATNPEPPVFLSTAPASPSRVSFQPAIFGTALKNSTTNFYSDLSCTQLIGSGSDLELQSTGIGLNLTADASVEIYGQTIDALTKKSSCVYLTKYKHTTYGPIAPVYSSISPASPNNSSLRPTIKAVSSADSVTVTIYSDSACAAVLSTGSPSDFSSLGFSFDAVPNTLMTIYAKSVDADNNPSQCVFLTNYIYDNIAPASPTYGSASPPNPTRLTVYPRISGFASGDTATIKFYKTPVCISATGSGTKAELEGAGILAGVDSNSTTSLYFAAFDAAGNMSACTFVLNYRHNTIPPDPPVFGSTNPVSPNNISASPIVSGNASITTRKVYFYSDETCTNLLSSGSAEDFNGVGILVPTPYILNAVNITNIFVTADDLEGNISECSQLTNYGYSTAKAPNPVFVQSVPASPAKSTNKPWILGGSPVGVSLITLFADSLCTVSVGSASRACFLPRVFKSL